MSFDASALGPGSDVHGGPQANISCLDFLLIELVPHAYRMTRDSVARDMDFIDNPSSGAVKSIATKPTLPSTSLPERKKTTSTATATIQSQAHSQHLAASSSQAVMNPSNRDSVVDRLGMGPVSGVDEEETRELVFARLDGLGYRVGLGVVDRFVRDKPRFGDVLDVIKFVCKDLWLVVWRKQVDGLKTNHRVCFVSSFTFCEEYGCGLDGWRVGLGLSSDGVFGLQCGLLLTMDCVGCVCPDG